MPFNIISYKKSIWKGIEGHLKGIVQKLEDSPQIDSQGIKQSDESPIENQSAISILRRRNH